MTDVLANLDRLLSGLPEVTPEELDGHGTYASMATKNLRPLVAAGEELRDKAKWAWQYISATALDMHNRHHDGRAVALSECPELPCPQWREDLGDYRDVIDAAEAALAALQRDIAKLEA